MELVKNAIFSHSLKSQKQDEMKTSYHILHSKNRKYNCAISELLLNLIMKLWKWGFVHSFRYCKWFEPRTRVMSSSGQVVETSLNITSNSTSQQDYTHPNDHNLRTYLL